MTGRRWKNKSKNWKRKRNTVRGRSRRSKIRRVRTVLNRANYGNALTVSKFPGLRKNGCGIFEEYFKRLRLISAAGKTNDLARGSAITSLCPTLRVLSPATRNALPSWEFLIQFFAKLSVCAEKTQAHGYVRNAQLVGHFVSRVVQNIHQQTDLAQVRG